MLDPMHLQDFHKSFFGRHFHRVYSQTEFTWISSGGVLLTGISRRWAAHEVKVPGGPRINGAKV